MGYKERSGERPFIICPLDHYKSSPHYTYDDEQGLVNNPNVADINKRVIKLPIEPSEIMFTEGSNKKNLELLNFGEVPVSMNKKLATWSVTSMFPSYADRRVPWLNYYLTTRTGKEEVEDIDPYEYFCNTFYQWKNNGTPLVFDYKTWGEPYYCQIDSFKFGNKDATDWVYYELSFQEFRNLANNTTDVSYSTNYSYTDGTPADYIAGEGDDIILICEKLYNTSDAYKYFMQLNGMTNPTITPGKIYKVR